MYFFGFQLFYRHSVDPGGWVLCHKYFMLSKFVKDYYIKKNEGKKWALVFQNKTYRF